MFNLEKAIAGWRRGLEASPALSAEDIEELECHVRDQIADRVGGGATPEEAFGATLEEVGPYGEMEGEFRKVFWQKAHARRTLKEEVRERLDAALYDLRLAYRNARRFGISTTLNVAGLSLGIGACVLIALFTLQELRFDRHHKAVDRIYRVVVERDDSEPSVSTPVGLAPELRRSVPIIQQAATFGPLWDGVMQSGQAQFHESRVFIGEPEILEILDFDFLAGTPASALSTPESMIITRSTANRYFGSTDVLGRRFEFTFEGSQEFAVSAVIEDIPYESHFVFDFLVPLSSQPMFAAADGSWDWDFLPTYVLLGPDAGEADLALALGTTAQPHGGVGLQALLPQALSDVHLTSHYDGEIGQNGDLRRIYGLGALAILILLIAVINFVNLSTALAATRSREVGVRKVMGAGRGSLVRQFMGEALLTALLAALAGSFLAVVAEPLFNQMAGAGLDLGPQALGQVLGASVLIGLTAGLLAGVYPAFVLSGSRPVAAIRRRSAGPHRGSFSRKALVSVQFGLTVFFLICIGVMHTQLRFVENRDTGIESDQIVYMRSPQRETPTPYAAFKNELEAIRGVASVTGAGGIPGSGSSPFRLDVAAEAAPETQRARMAVYFVHPDFAEVFGLRWIRGGLPPAMADSVRLLVANQAAAEALGLSDEPFPVLEGWAGDQSEPGLSAPLTGIVHNFQFESLHREIQPALLIVSPRTHTWTYLAARLDVDGVGDTIGAMETAWSRVAPEWPLEIEFLDERFQAMYEREDRMRATFGVFAVLAIIIACLGLFGLAVFSTQERTKEIGVRKVLGAGVPGIVLLLSRDFLIPVVVGFVLAAPVAWLITARWLSGFAYRIDMPVWVYAASALLAVGIAFLTVSGQTLGTARRNPSLSLRYE